MSAAQPTGQDVAARVFAEVERIGDEVVASARADTGKPPATAHDPEWPSPCIVEVVGVDRCHWLPVPMAEPPAFTRLEHALEVSVHPAFRAYYSVRWSAALPVRYHDEKLELLQLWSEQDFELLLANQIGHALEKRRIGEPLTLFFAVIDDDRFLAVDNESGAVVVEAVGRRGPLEVSDSLVDFLTALEPG